MFNSNIVLKDNAMLKRRPELFNEWNFEENSKFGVDIYQVSRGSDKKYWWNCFKCKSIYDCSVSNKIMGRSCPYCKGLKVNLTNSLDVLFPDALLEWDWVKNSGIDPSKVTAKSTKKAWWIGKDCGHSYDTEIRNRTILKTGCPYCSPTFKKVLKGFNDMWTTDPKLAKLLANPEDGYRNLSGSQFKVDWKCPTCHSIVKEKSIQYIKREYRVPCVNCTDGFSFAERAIFHLLIENNIEFQSEKTFKWSGKMRYDFYLSEYNYIIESHGMQHYEDIIFHAANIERGLEYQQKRDVKKRELAIENGIKKYIVIDARESNIDFIFNSISKSELKEILKIRNKKVVEEKSNIRLVKTASDLWNSGMSVGEISKILKVVNSTTYNYLKKGAIVELCDYTPKESSRRSSKLAVKGRKIVQLSLTNDFIKKWDTVTKACISLNITEPMIRKCCQGKKEKTKGYKFMYLEDYQKRDEFIDVHD